MALIGSIQTAYYTHLSVEMRKISGLIKYIRMKNLIFWKNTGKKRRSCYEADLIGELLSYSPEVADQNIKPDTSPY